MLAAEYLSFDEGKSVLIKRVVLSFEACIGHLLTIRTLHDCPSQMNENLLISNSKLTSDSEFICEGQSCRVCII